jgi:hypothetical protein
LASLPTDQAKIRAAHFLVRLGHASGDLRRFTEAMEPLTPLLHQGGPGLSPFGARILADAHYRQALKAHEEAHGPTAIYSQGAESFPTAYLELAQLFFAHGKLGEAVHHFLEAQMQ